MRHLTLALLLLAAPPLAADRVSAQLVNNRVLIPVAVNGLAPASFILDTGAAATTLEKEYAAQNGIRSAGSTRAMGAAGSIDVGVSGDVVYEFAGRRAATSRSPLIPLAAVNRRSGRAVQGILGYEAFISNVVEIDYAGGSVAFHDPKTFRAPKEAVTVPLAFHHKRTPVVNVQLTMPGGRKVSARLLLDTGASTALMLTRTFVDKNGVEVDGGIETAMGLGVGGATRERTGRIARLDFAGFAFDRPIALLSRVTKGALGDGAVDGILGGEILRRFTLHIDYKRKQLLLTPNAALGDPIDIDMTGALFESRDETFTSLVVHTVLESSPAAEAGIRVGDQLRAIDGRAVTPAQLDEIRRMFKQPERTYTLTLVRDGAERTITIVTRRMT